jgi:hypothetical protein
VCVNDDNAFDRLADKTLTEAVELDPMLRTMPQWPDGPTWRELAALGGDQ